jgi:hypothetical protein
VAYGRNTLDIKAIVAYGCWHKILHALVLLWQQFENIERMSNHTDKLFIAFKLKRN